MMINYIVIGFIILPILFGLFQYMMKKLDLKIFSLMIHGVILLGTVYVLLFSEFTQVLTVPLLSITRPIGMTLQLDSLSMTMILLNNIIFMIMSYSSYHRDYYNKLFIFLICLLQGLINGIFLSNDFFNLYLLIEIATIVVSILIMYKKDGRSLYDGMLYLVVNMVGMAFFLMGIGYVYKIFGVLDFNTVSQLITLVPKSSLILPFAFLITGASLKSAFMPVFSWLPKAHGTASAPTMVSAILSGIFVKTGIYLFIRITNLFGPVINLSEIFLVVAIFTTLFGAVFAMSHTDIKLIMSYSTISQVGIIMLGLNNVSITGYTGGIFYLFNHGIFKVLMFFCVGLLIKIYKTRKIEEMHSLWQTSKVISFGLIIGLLSLTGFPLLGSGIGKYMIGQYYSNEMIKLLFMIISVTSMLYCIPLFKIMLPKSLKSKTIILSNQRNTIFILSTILVILGLAYQPILRNIFDYDIVIKSSKLIDKAIEYTVLLTISTMLYLISSKLGKIRDKIKLFDLGFNTINLAIVSYFAIIVVAAQRF